MQQLTTASDSHGAVWGLPTLSHSSKLFADVLDASVFGDDVEETQCQSAVSTLVTAGHGPHLHELVLLVCQRGMSQECTAPTRLSQFVRSLCNAGIIPTSQVPWV